MRVPVLGVLVACLAGPVWGQEGVAVDEEHPLVGRVVRVDGVGVPGRGAVVERVGSDSLYLVMGRERAPVSVALADVDRLRARRPASRPEGAIRWAGRGLAIGVVGAGLLCVTLPAECRLENDGVDPVVNPAAMMILNGAGSAFYGAVGGALFPGHRWDRVPLGPHVLAGTRVRLGLRQADGAVRLATGTFVRDVPGGIVVALDGSAEPVTLRWDEIALTETNLGRPPLARTAVPLAGAGAFIGAAGMFGMIFGWSCEPHWTRAECERESNRLLTRALLGGATVGAALGTAVAVTLPREDRWSSFHRPLTAARIGVGPRGVVLRFEV